MPHSRLHDEDLIRAGVVARLQGATAVYGDQPVLLEAGFEANAGTAHVILGAAGSGKTTLINVLALRMRLRGGVYDLLGANTARLRVARLQRFRQRIGVVEESPAFIEHMSVVENVALPLSLSGAASRAHHEDVEELLAFVGATPIAQCRVADLSRAERRLAAVARALVGKPDLILADDPAVGLGAEAGMRILRVLAEMRRVGAAVVIACGDAEAARGIAATQWRLAHGRILAAEATR